MLMLDGTDYDRDWLVQQAVDDSFYYGPLNKLAHSSSSLKMLLDSPKTYHNVMKYGKEESSPALLMGRVIHTMILEPEKFDDIFEVVLENTRQLHTHTYPRTHTHPRTPTHTRHAPVV